MRRLILGQVPAEETPAAPTSPAALANCRQLRSTVREAVGAEPAGSTLGIVLVAGRGYVLAYHYSGARAEQQEHAERILWHAPLSWGAAGRTQELGGSL